MLNYELSPGAEHDLQDIIRYTAEQWGAEQVRKYTKALEQCIIRLAKGEGYYKAVEDLYPNMRLVRCQHHYIFAIIRPDLPMLVVAIFHKRMDLIVQLKNRLD